MSIPHASNCSTCGRPYRKDILKLCPSCASREDSNVNTRAAETSISAKSQQYTAATESPEVERLLRAIVVSTGKTTHAVRAFVRFLFIQLSATTLAGLFIFWSNPFSNESNDFLFWVGALIYLGGFVWSSAAGWHELSESE